MRNAPPQDVAPADALLSAALEIVESEGLAGLTLRPLARRIGVTPSYLSGRFGSKSDVFRHVIERARRVGAHAKATWTQRLEDVDAFTPSLAADLCEAMLDDIVLNHRPLYVLYLELFQARTWDEVLAGAFEGWLGEETRFWDLIGTRFGLPAPLIASGLFNGYVLDELAFSICLRGNAPYRLMRKLTMKRLFDGFRRPADWEAEGRLFAKVFGELDYNVSELRVVHGATLSGGWPERVMQASANLITTSGVSAVTHRATAALADVKPTTLAYRFPTQEDLVVGGLEYIIARLLTRMEHTAGFEDVAGALEDGDDPNIGRATFAVALAAVRMPRLTACAADMRRRRGINLIRLIDREFAPGRSLDASSAQAIAAGLAPLTIVRPEAQQIARIRAASALRAAMDWALDARANIEAGHQPEDEAYALSRFPVPVRDPDP